MTRLAHRSAARNRPTGLGLIEAVITLVICSTLLLAIGSAYVASAQAITVNDNFFRASQAARVAMTQLQSAIRRSDALQVPSSTRVDLIAFDARDLSYVYNSASRQLRLVTNASTTDPDYVLARNVTAVSFAADSENDPDTGTSRVVRVTINLDLNVGNEQIHLSGSAVPRRALVY
ncbi:MAG: hypothetical protein ABIP55_13390 [Tepidisphaeraceae bacterium]